jgi:uncharacterized membrane protein
MKRIVSIDITRGIVMVIMAQGKGADACRFNYAKPN